MDLNDQQRYEAVMKGRDQDVCFNEGWNGFLQQTARNTSTAVPLTYRSELSANVFTMPEWPPSIRDAAKNLSSGPDYQGLTKMDTLGLAAYSVNEGGQSAATAPFSFHHRSLQLALLQMEHEFEVSSEDSFNRLPSSQRADSAIGSFDDLLGFDNSAEATNFPYDGSSANQGDDPSYQPGPLQYHLIRTESVMKNKKSVVDLLHQRRSIESTSSDNRTLLCPLCANRQYTGVWAHRNLTRHMDSVHAPSSSSSGAKHIRCSYEDCDRTFRREDARLVHERRSHPELNRPPPTKRKRSGDL